jgi:murein DD-endopeptidase MepM/ murein hydrolase activator NlpD
MPAEERASLKTRGISSGFGERAVSRKRTRMHKGIDVPGPKDSKVIAYNDGEVIFVGVRNWYGKPVIVRQLDGRNALYAHMNKYVVSVGDTLRRGDHVGHVGRTGRATGYHLHFEIIDEEKNLDPALHVWHGSELVLAPGGPDQDRTRVAEPVNRRSSPVAL